MTRVIPAPLLDAADRNEDPLAGGHEHGRVEGAVLLGAEHLLALVDEQRKVGRVLDAEPGHDRAALDLLDEGAELGCWTKARDSSRGSGPKTGKTASGPATCGPPRVYAAPSRADWRSAFMHGRSPLLGRT